MPDLLIRHKVTDFAAWRQVFLDEEGVRQANGAGETRCFRTAADPSEVWILIEWDDLHRARLFVRSDDLMESVARAGVTDQPDYWFLERGEWP